MISHDGMGCVAALDVDTGTLTLIHSGALARMNNKPETPRIIPLGAIESVEFTKSTMMKRGFVRFLLRGQSGYHRDPNRDINAYLLKSLKDKTAEPFVEAVQSAIASAPPVHEFGAPGTPEEIRRPGLVETVRDSYQEARELAADRAAGRAFGKFRLIGESFHYEDQSWPVAGASVTIESAGIARSRLTATRVVGGALLFGGTGALIGAAGRKDQSTIFLTVELADGSVVVDEVPIRAEGDARKFAAVVNSASRQQARGLESRSTRQEPDHLTQAAPISQGPPPGWYPEPQGSGGNRWWDGTTWTDHRQPEA